MNIKGQGNVFNPNTNSKKSNLKAFIIIGIVVVMCLIAILYYLQVTNKEIPVRATVNGTYTTGIVESIFVDESGITYFPVKYIAQVLGYRAYSGNSQQRSEEQSQCYVESDLEVVDITNNSARVYKYLKNTSQAEYEYVDLNKIVRSNKGELYIPYDGITKIFNTSYYYDQNNLLHIFQTLDDKYTRLNKSIMDYTNIGASNIDSKFVNKKALLENLAVVRSSTDGKFGLVDLSDTKNPRIILELKYDEITYIPSLKMFLVSSNGKVGIFEKDGSTLFNIEYQELSLIDSDTKLFAIKKDGKYGIGRSRYDIKLDIDYETIGINASQFSENGIINKYFLLGNMIPVKKDGKWGFVDKECNKLTDCIYDQIGSSTSTSGSRSNLLYIPNYNVLIAKRDYKYTLLNSYGEELFSNLIDDCYIYNNSNTTQYMMVVNDKEYDIVEQYLKQKLKTDAVSNSNNKDDDSNNSNEGGQTFGDYYQPDNDNDDNNDDNNDE